MCKKLGGILPNKDIKYSSEFKESLEILKWDITPEEIISASRFLMIATFFFFLVLTIFFVALGLPFIYPLVGMLAFPFLIAHLVTEYPKSLAKLEIIKALGNAPRTLAYLVILLKQNPNLEEAVRFAAEFGEGPIGEDLRRMTWDVWSGKKINVKSALPELAEKWGKYSVEFKRAIYSIISALSEKSDIRRGEILDRALRVVLDGIMYKTRNFVNSLYVPTMLLFSFGTVIPLMAISLLPVLSVFGIDIVNSWSVALFLSLTALTIYIYSNVVLNKRPATFSPVDLENVPGGPREDELQLGSTRVSTLVIISTILILLGFPGVIFLFWDWKLIYIPIDSRLLNYLSLSLVWAVGIAISVYAFGKSNYKKKLVKSVKRLESEIVEAMYSLAGRMMEGKPPEEAIYFVSKSFPGTEIGKIMDKAYNNIKKRNVTLEEAFFNPRFGALKDVHSKTVKSLIKLFVVSTKKGYKVSAQMVMVIASNFDELSKVESELKNMLAKSIAMLKMTVLFIAPVVSGVVVVLYDVLVKNLVMSQEKMRALGYVGNLFGIGMMTKPPSLSVGMLALLIGLYLVFIDVVLTRYIVIIENGPNKTLVLDSIYKVIPVSLIIFTLSIILTGSLMGGL